LIHTLRYPPPPMILPPFRIAPYDPQRSHARLLALTGRFSAGLTLSCLQYWILRDDVPYGQSLRCVIPVTQNRPTWGQEKMVSR
jgi:hypothetical protein